MSLWKRWLRQPQTVGFRRVIFQFHLWVGLALGLYVCAISVTGSILVFRSELLRAFTEDPIIVEVRGTRLDAGGIREAAVSAYPGYHIVNVFEGRHPNQAVEIWLERDDGGRRQQLFDPFTGEDLGRAVPAGIRLVSWLLDLHDNLLFGETGRKLNGAASGLFSLLALTGVVVWWPGARNWTRSLVVRWRTNWKRFNWSLHSAAGFWTALLLLIWGVSGVYLVFPTPFNAVVDWIEPFDTNAFEPRVGDEVLRWLARLHFGRFAGMPVKVAWALLGLVPPLLFVTGTVMWWNRAVRKRPLDG